MGKCWPGGTTRITRKQSPESGGPSEFVPRTISGICWDTAQASIAASEVQISDGVE
jgi:hypothetical protein